MLNGFAPSKAISIVGRGQGTEGIGVKRVGGVHVQITEVGVAIRVGIRPSIDNRVLCCKQGLRERRTLRLSRRIHIATTSAKQRTRERNTG